MMVHLLTIAALILAALMALSTCNVEPLDEFEHLSPWMNPPPYLAMCAKERPQ